MAEGLDPLDIWAEPKHFPEVHGVWAVHVFDGMQERLLDLDCDTGRIVHELPFGKPVWL